jgi:hypothetical protein
MLNVVSKAGKLISLYFNEADFLYTSLSLFYSYIFKNYYSL